ncbi:MAG: dephospho-CoA kinase [Thermodesulfovibrionales bacterium]
MITAGLTGNFGMGKSSVLRLFEACGALTLDSDRIVAGLLEQPEIIEKVSEELGSGVTDAGGRLMKKVVAEKIFNDPVLKRKLEDILHPLVFARIDAFVRDPGHANRLIVVEVPLLFETGSSARFDRTITVHTTSAEAEKRLMQKGVRQEEARARLQTQMPIAEKIRLADHAIDNNGSQEDTKKQVEALYRLLVSGSRTS